MRWLNITIPYKMIDLCVSFFNGIDVGNILSNRG